MRRIEHEAIDGADGKRCTKCGDWYPLEHFHKQSSSYDGLAYVCRPCARRAVRKVELKRLYGITVEQYEQMLVEQGGVCAVCAHACPTGHALSVDHDHTTGEVRELLCRNCNSALGLLDEDTDRIFALAAYAIKHQPLPLRVKA